MKAWVMESFGAPEVLELREDLPLPQPGAGEVRVLVKAIAVARTKDVAMRAGQPPFGPVVTLPHTPGTEHAGVVDAIGPGTGPDDAERLLGARVAVSAVMSCATCVACRRGHDEACSSFELVGVHRPGSYAEFVVVPMANVHPIPEDLTFAAAAALAANGPVARAQLDAGEVGPGSVVAVMGAAGALGSAAACLAHYRGATVFAVDQLATKGELLAQLPIERSFDGNDPELAAAMRAATDGWGVDCIVDNLGLAPLWANYRSALAPLGRIVVSGAIGREAIALQLLPFYLHSQALVGVRTGNRAQVRALWGDVQAGFRMPTASAVARPWQDMHAVHHLVEQGQAVAQTVLEVRTP